MNEQIDIERLDNDRMEALALAYLKDFTTILHEL